MTPHPLEGVDDVMQAARIIGLLLSEEKAGNKVRAYPRNILRQQHVAAFTLVNPFATTTEICAYFGISPSVLTNIRKSDTYKALVSAHNIAVGDLSEDINQQLRETLKVAIEVTQDAVITKRDPEYALATMDKIANRLGMGAKHNNFKDHPWIQYLLPNGQLKYCQPDFVLLSRTDDNLLIIDAKVRHTRDVVSQLVRYRDIIRPLHPTFTPNLVEICRYFDSSECRMELLPELRPHNYNVAAVIFEPRQWMPATN
jgi:hypothetical protein